MSSLGHDFLQIETYFLKVHINCQGCQRRVKKLLRKIEGVFSVKIDAERQVVCVSGTVEPDTLINKLRKSGKHAELCFPTPSFNQININGGGNIQWNKNPPRQGLINGFQALKNIDYASEREDRDWGMQTYLNQNIGTEAVTTHHEVEPNFTTATKDEISAMMQMGFHGSEANRFQPGGHGFTSFQDFSPLGYDYNHNHSGQITNNMQPGSYFEKYSPWTPTQDYAHLSPMMMNSLQQGYQHYNNDHQMRKVYMDQPRYGFSHESRPYY